VEENGAGTVDGLRDERRECCKRPEKGRVGLDQALVGEGMLKNILEGRALGRRGRGRKMKGFPDGMKGRKTSCEMKREIGPGRVCMGR
jgi:hypothetical protein